MENFCFSYLSPTRVNNKIEFDFSGYQYGLFTIPIAIYNLTGEEIKVRYHNKSFDIPPHYSFNDIDNVLNNISCFNFYNRFGEDYPKRHVIIYNSSLKEDLFWNNLKQNTSLGEIAYQIHIIHLNQVYESDFSDLLFERNPLFKEREFDIDLELQKDATRINSMERLYKLINEVGGGNFIDYCKRNFKKFEIEELPYLYIKPQYEIFEVKKGGDVKRYSKIIFNFSYYGGFLEIEGKITEIRFSDMLLFDPSSEIIIFYDGPGSISSNENQIISFKYIRLDSFFAYLSKKDFRYSEGKKKYYPYKFYFVFKDFGANREVFKRDFLSKFNKYKGILSDFIYRRSEILFID